MVVLVWVNNSFLASCVYKRYVAVSIVTVLVVPSHVKPLSGADVISLNLDHLNQFTLLFLHKHTGEGGKAKKGRKNERLIEREREVGEERTKKKKGGERGRERERARARDFEYNLIECYQFVYM